MTTFSTMIEAVNVTEFPFVSELPKREKSELARAWDRLVAFERLQTYHGPCVPASVAAALLGISRQRVYQLIEQGRFARLEIEGHCFIPTGDVRAYAESERKTGRPCSFKPTEVLIQAAKAGWKIGSDDGKKKS